MDEMAGDAPVRPDSGRNGRLGSAGPKWSIKWFTNRNQTSDSQPFARKMNSEGFSTINADAISNTNCFNGGGYQDQSGTFFTGSTNYCYQGTPSPADSGVMSPMTPMSSYTAMTSPENPVPSGSSSPYSQNPVNSGVMSPYAGCGAENPVNSIGTASCSPYSQPSPTDSGFNNSSPYSLSGTGSSGSPYSMTGSVVESGSSCVNSAQFENMWQQQNNLQNQNQQMQMNNVRTTFSIHTVRFLPQRLLVISGSEKLIFFCSSSSSWYSFSLPCYVFLCFPAKSGGSFPKMGQIYHVDRWLCPKIKFRDIKTWIKSLSCLQMSL